MTIDQPATQPPGPLAPTAGQLTERLFADAITTMETLSMQLGLQLGLYRALADGPADPRQLAERAGIHPRYAREWLESQAVSAILEAAVAELEEHGYAADRRAAMTTARTRTSRPPGTHRPVRTNFVIAKDSRT
jgi:hypothetical protein